MLFSYVQYNQQKKTLLNIFITFIFILSYPILSLILLVPILFQNIGNHFY